MTLCGIQYKNLGTGQRRRCTKPADHRDRCHGPVVPAPPSDQADDRNYVQSIIDQLHAELPDCDLDLIGFYALLVLVAGPSTTFQDVHDAWAVWRNQTDPEHRSLKPFDELTPEVQELDSPYRATIVRVASVEKPNEIRICIDASCPSCNWPERLFSPTRGLFGCARCRYVSTEREA